MRKISIGLIAGTLFLCGCSMTGSLKSKKAIQGAIETHLRGNPHLSLKNFDTQVESVKYKGNTAEATAKFVSKSDPSVAVDVQYQLKLDGRTWKVVSSRQVGGMGMGLKPHEGAAGSMGMGAHEGAGGSMYMGQPVPGQKSQTSQVPAQPSH